MRHDALWRERLGLWVEMKGSVMQSTTRAAPDPGLEDLDRILEEFDLRSEDSAPPRPEEGFALSGGILPRKVENPMPRLSILLPALNEEGGIHAVLRMIPEQSLRRMGFRPVVQLLDGGSTDRTRMVALDHGAKVYVQKGWGKGSAFREFLPTLRSEYCVILDSDATYPAAWIPIFAETLRKGAPVVLGSRFKGKIEDGAMSAANKLGNRLLSFFASLLYQRRVSDVCSGMWGFRTDVLKSFALSADGFDLEANIYAECVRHGLPIVEVPIPYFARIGSAKLRVRTGLRIAWALFLNRIRPSV
jgi:glycosyltransferase involved in cell wall biosynthesis